MRSLPGDRGDAMEEVGCALRGSYSAVDASDATHRGLLGNSVSNVQAQENALLIIFPKSFQTVQNYFENVLWYSTLQYDTVLHVLEKS